MFSKLKLKSKAKDVSIADPAATPGQGPDKRQIYRNRYNYGVNLGACFVNEKWIFHEMFGDNCETELDAVSLLVKQVGIDEAKQKFEHHWTNFMSDNDWNWLQDHDVKSVRIPVGYWNLDSHNSTKGTKFSSFAKVYENSWSIIEQKFIDPAGQRNISVLIDLHGLPSGANSSDHSGEKNGGNADFWNNSQYQLQIIDSLKWTVKNLQKFDNICGIQIVNEANFANNNSKQVRYYSGAINGIRSIDGSIPIVISDGWWTNQWVDWVQSNQNDSESIGVVIDHHVYRCFSDDDKCKAPQKIIDDLQNDVLTNLSNNGQGVDLMVGEYSCVLDGDSWNRDNAQSKLDELVVKYGNCQIEIFKQRGLYGNYFWTYKFQSGNGGEWDFKTMTDKGAIYNPCSYRGKNLPDQQVFDETLNNQLQQHENYWNNQNPNENYEHHRYKEGFTTAWQDCLQFAKFDGSAIGRIEAWKIARYSEHVHSQGKSNFLWEWTQGFDAGIREFRNCMS